MHLTVQMLIVGIHGKSIIGNGRRVRFIARSPRIICIQCQGRHLFPFDENNSLFRKSDIKPDLRNGGARRSRLVQIGSTGL